MFPDVGRGATGASGATARPSSEPKRSAHARSIRSGSEGRQSKHLLGRSQEGIVVVARSHMRAPPYRGTDDEQGHSIGGVVSLVLVPRYEDDRVSVAILPRLRQLGE